MKIVCVGGGPAGLFFSLLMKQRHPDYDIEVRERQPEGQVQGWGVVLWPEVLEKVTAADAGMGNALAAALHRWNGARTVRRGELRVNDAAYGLAAARRELLPLLAGRARDAGVTVRYGCEVDPADLPAADLVVAADGVGSRLRRARTEEFGSQLTPSTNRYVWLGVTRNLPSFTFAFMSTEAGWMWCHSYGHNKDHSTFIVECQPETWDGLRLDSLNTEETLGLLERIFAGHLGGGNLLAPPGSGDKITWLTFSTLTNRVWHLDNLVLVGDAAHTTHFSIGSGTTLALEDAIGLFDALESTDDLEAALTAYEAVRRPEVENLQRSAVNSLRWLENFSRYSDFPMDDFVDLLDRRRSAVQGRIPPRVYLRLRHLADSRSVLRRWAGRLLRR